MQLAASLIALINQMRLRMLKQIHSPCCISTKGPQHCQRSQQADPNELDCALLPQQAKLCSAVASVKHPPLAAAAKLFRDAGVDLYAVLLQSLYGRRVVAGAQLSAQMQLRVSFVQLVASQTYVGKHSWEALT